ncbi:DUF5999 family protein [Streptomyces sp. C]|uniref:DUF5999 family protein n=1 Tax=Streptomyces sp. C TaxID=253839 RepID=UPI0001B4F280|nr:DUF5999 family protein [Streptomyces sp. C]EFL19892.1 conserved hypothetical protein [Streptomyces sp. C]
MCQHKTPCPSAEAPDGARAVTVDPHADQGWVRLCNGAVLFDDTGLLLPNGQAVAPHRPLPTSANAA